MHCDDTIYLAGHQGLVGSSLMRLLIAQGYKKIITQTIDQLDLRNQNNVIIFFERYRPAYVFLAAAKVGGIKANSSYRAEFMYDNLMIAANVIEACYKYNVKKLLFLGSSCIYPVGAPQPLKEDYLLTGSLEHTNEPYALAKIAGIKLCESYNRQYGSNFISVMPTNLYGPGDTFDVDASHVIPALIMKIMAAHTTGQSSCTLWGNGISRREFLFVDDLSDALVLLMQTYNDVEPINIGWGSDITIKELAHMIAHIIGYQGVLLFDSTQPSGAAQKLLDITKLSQQGWRPTISLEQGLHTTIQWYKNNYLSSKAVKK